MATSRPVAARDRRRRGIGVEVCRQLVERGFSVVLGSRDLAKGERAAKQLPGSSRHDNSTLRTRAASTPQRPGWQSDTAAATR